MSFKISRLLMRRNKMNKPMSLLPVVMQQPTLSDMTMYEMNFSLLVEDTLKNIVLPEYRQIIVEARSPLTSSTSAQTEDGGSAKLNG